MIKSIKHKALNAYWTKGKTKGLDAKWLGRLDRVLDALEAAETAEEANYPGSGFHALTGNLKGRYAMKLTANFRITFGWSGKAAIDVDIEDYH